jgi:hypothetical protein
MDEVKASLQLRASAQAGAYLPLMSRFLFEAAKAPSRRDRDPKTDPLKDWLA